MTSVRYRSSNMIILMILETIIRGDNTEGSDNGDILKSHLIEVCGLKSQTANKYLHKMEKAGYITPTVKNWGKRQIISYSITDIGYERYDWFVKINAEME